MHRADTLKMLVRLNGALAGPTLGRGLQRGREAGERERTERVRSEATGRDEGHAG